MPAIRFATIADLYDTFPTAPADVGAPRSDTPSLTFLQSLVATGSWSPAVSFCAYLLPRREAVWWGCQSLRRMQPQRTPPEAAALAAAEAWVREPEEHLRRAALDRGTEGDAGWPATWMALAAGWSGGSIAAPEFGIVPVAPYQTARAIRAGLLIAMADIPSAETPELLKPCIEAAIDLAVGRST
jgi:hypothetical protein